MWWYTIVISPLGRQRQNDQEEFEANLSHMFQKGRELGGEEGRKKRER